MIDCHVFVGNQLGQYDIQVKYGADVKLLEMNTNIPSSTPKYRLADTEYQISTYNQKLVDNGLLTTDHYPIVVDVTWQMKSALLRSLS